MKTLKIYSSKERFPKNNEMVLLFEESTYLGIDTQDIKYIELEYFWEEIDPVDGQWTGTTYSFHSMSKKPKNCVLKILDRFTGNTLPEIFLYSKTSDVDKIFKRKNNI